MCSTVLTLISCISLTSEYGPLIDMCECLVVHLLTWILNRIRRTETKLHNAKVFIILQLYTCTFSLNKFTFINSLAYQLAQRLFGF